jgi:NTE family protein
LRLSDYRTGEFAGTGPRLARLVYTCRLAPSSLLDGVFVGVSAEAGRIREVLDNPVARGTLRSNALFIGAATLPGPLYLGYGRAAGGRDALYIFLGVP